MNILMLCILYVTLLIMYYIYYIHRVSSTVHISYILDITKRLLKVIL